MSDIDRAAEKIFTDEVRNFAEKFVSGVLAEVANAKPPCSGGERPRWTAAIKQVLGQMGSGEGYEAYNWEPLLDFVWWSRKDGGEEMILAVESELDEDVCRPDSPRLSEAAIVQVPAETSHIQR